MWEPDVSLLYNFGRSLAQVPILGARKICTIKFFLEYRNAERLNVEPFNAIKVDRSSMAFTWRMSYYQVTDSSSSAVAIECPFNIIFTSDVFKLL